MTCEIKSIGLNKHRLLVDDKNVTVAFFSELKFGVENYCGKHVINFEINKKIEDYIKEIENIIFQKLPGIPYSSIRKNKWNPKLKPILRTYLRYITKDGKKILKTIVKQEDEVVMLKNIKSTNKLKIHIYLDHIWIQKDTTIGLCWYIDLINVL